jgi:hypothetical protein
VVGFLHPFESGITSSINERDMALVSQLGMTKEQLARLKRCEEPREKQADWNKHATLPCIVIV